MRNIGIFSLILSICAIVLSFAFLSTVQTVQKNQNNIISRVESLEQNSGEDPGEDPGETPTIKNYVEVVELQPGDTLQLTDEMYCVDVELRGREPVGGIYSDPVEGDDTNVRIDLYSGGEYDPDAANSYRFRYYLGTNNYIYQFTAMFSGDYRIDSAAVYFAGSSLPFLRLSEDGAYPAIVIIYYL